VLLGCAAKGENGWVTPPLRASFSALRFKH
jgi:hypothetical protein